MLVSICLFHQATDSVAAVFQLITLFMCALLACFPSGFPLLDEGKNTKEHVPSQPDSTDSSSRSSLGTTKCQTEQPQHTIVKSPLMVYKAGEYPATSASIQSYLQQRDLPSAKLCSQAKVQVGPFHRINFESPLWPSLILDKFEPPFT